MTSCARFQMECNVLAVGIVAVSIRCELMDVC